ncbi:hypothetical protein [Taklimakanibacter albus]|uniref:Uncharacterized protein n=1 Tax=Taklimakanibacter albus TaxID=2800327 RepID=A0ACC5RCM7_9HYPH|nr:hypothetical protein [Aestuariivirga sp. YIM B02566]MBK1870451.1 hypothetical protein [Aestuariivirga sp. YIM B02566]
MVAQIDWAFDWIEEDVEIPAHREGGIGVIIDRAARQVGSGTVVQKSRRQALVLIFSSFVMQQDWLALQNNV